jgi:hypothetical protein
MIEIVLTTGSTSYIYCTDTCIFIISLNIIKIVLTTCFTSHVYHTDTLILNTFISGLDNALIGLRLNYFNRSTIYFYYIDTLIFNISLNIIEIVLITSPRVISITLAHEYRIFFQIVSKLSLLQILRVISITQTHEY